MKHLFSTVLLVMGLSASAQTIMNIYQGNGTLLQIPLNSIDSITYTVNAPGDLAILTTLPMGNITATTAVSGGDITDGGGTSVTHRGVCWSTSPNPTTADNTTNDGSGLGSYNSELTGLVAGGTYYVRAYATNSAGTAYGNEVQFTAVGSGLYTPGPGVTDINGTTYATITLNNGQEWMAENLRSTRYANGDTIPNVTVSGPWLGLTTGAWVHYANNTANENLYGKLYNWYAVADARNVCPAGWHVPTDVEWQALEIALGMPAGEVNNTGFRGAAQNVGGQLKRTGTQYWLAPNTGATNESGFSGLPGGYRNEAGSFVVLGGFGYWWTASVNGSGTAWVHALSSQDGGSIRGFIDQNVGYSVRCLRD